MKEVSNSIGTVSRTDGVNEPLLLGRGSTGEPVVLFTGSATSDATIVAEVGADANWADGSLYISIANAAGALFQKRNDVWTSI